MKNKLPTSKFARANVVGKAMLKIGIKKTSHLITKKDSTQSHEEIADILFDALGELKGVSVKIAQQVALGMPFLSPIYLEKISKSFSAIPPINKALVRKIIKTELGDTPQKVFDSFEMEAFAAASLGQVHLATKDAQSLAVKVQYSGIKKSIETDMSLIHFALKRFAKGHDVSHLIQEIEARLYEEIDYEKEAKNCAFFYKHLQNKDISIPKVYKQFSTQKVLTTSLLKGVTFETFLAQNPSQESKNHYAQLLFDSFFDALYRLRHIHADPNPGNFIFMENNRLGLIDFGCVKSISQEFLSQYNQLHLNLIDHKSDEDIVLDYVKLGMISQESDKKMLAFYQEVIKPLDSLYKEPLIDDSYDFSIHTDFSKRGFEMIFEVQQKQTHSGHKLNAQFFFINRTFIGYYALFEKMSAQIDTRKVKGMMRGLR
jgi:predicted unusual protein kinase regulating ubiquinone biosynthesis (AarF/ABC1/UbiB family)